ncbi:hypothetical protein KEM52_002865 [Ascosphaera acerosa]|nr:hypothetical protein KEM52_002865 [Ascosphaera acerosa]
MLDFDDVDDILEQLKEGGELGALLSPKPADPTPAAEPQQFPVKMLDLIKDAKILQLPSGDRLLLDIFKQSLTSLKNLGPEWSAFADYLAPKPDIGVKRLLETLPCLDAIVAVRTTMAAKKNEDMNKKRNNGTN